ncbi:MAG: hypothetical protein OCU22_06395 [Canidatus Methanoxibalbensis ujae]|nr:hypothetical protein [Candidatus Methanoxibalbensis ujae]
MRNVRNDDMMHGAPLSSVMNSAVTNSGHRFIASYGDHTAITTSDDKRVSEKLRQLWLEY